MSAATLILIAPCSLLIGAALQILVVRLCSARTKGILAALFCLPSLLAVAGTIPMIQAGRPLYANLFAWDGPLALVLQVDALSALFALMGAGIGGFVLVYSIGYMAHDKSATRFYATMLVFIAAFIGLVYSVNLFIFFQCFFIIVGVTSACSLAIMNMHTLSRSFVS